MAPRFSQSALYFAGFLFVLRSSLRRLVPSTWCKQTCLAAFAGSILGPRSIYVSGSAPNAMETLRIAMQSFCWRLRWLFRRRGVKPELISVIEMADYRRLLEEGRAPYADVPKVCWICDIVCRHDEQFLEHLRGHKHLKRRRALFRDH